jgi:hypothetical protein
VEASNAGFRALATPMGFVFIVVGTMLLIGMIVLGAGLIRAKEAQEKESRAEMRRRLESQKPKE